MQNKDIEKKIEALIAMASNLTPYLYEKEVFGELGGSLPKLTIGGLLLRLHQLEHLAPTLSPDQQSRIHDARINFEETRAEWAVHYEEKVLQEMESRLNAILYYLDECAKQEADCAAGWLNEAEKRTIIAHLHDIATQDDFLTSEISQLLAQVDGKIRRHFRTGDFLWDAILQDAYPHEDFWWLYGSMREPDEG